MAQPKCCSQTAFVAHRDTSSYRCVALHCAMWRCWYTVWGVPLPSLVHIAVPSAGLVSLWAAPCCHVLHTGVELAQFMCIEEFRPWMMSVRWLWMRWPALCLQKRGYPWGTQDQFLRSCLLMSGQPTHTVRMDLGPDLAGSCSDFGH